MSAKVVAFVHILLCLRLFHCIIYEDNPCMDWEQLFVLGSELHLVVLAQVILWSFSQSQSWRGRQCWERNLFAHLQQLLGQSTWNVCCLLSLAWFKVLCFRRAAPEFFSGFGSLGMFYALCWPKFCLQKRLQSALVPTQHSLHIV